MATLMQTFEQQYSVLSAEITVKIGQVPNLHGGAKLSLISDVEHQIDEVRSGPSLGCVGGHVNFKSHLDISDYYLGKNFRRLS